MFTVNSFIEAKTNGDKITMLTAYDFSMAKILDKAGVDCILVGDSLGMIVQGYDSTLEVTMEDMIYHCRGVRKGTENAFVVGDLPFMSYHVHTEDAVRNAGRLVQEGKVHGVKIEGGIEVVDKVRAIINAQIPVMGHIGLTPQSVNIFGGFKVQGNEIERAKKVIADAIALEEAGAFAIVLEAIPGKLAKIISEKVSIPTIGIGAGKDCDGQVLVINDLLGMYSEFTPKFAKKYANLKDEITNSVVQYIEEVKHETFPEEKHTFSIKEDIIETIVSDLI